MTGTFQNTAVPQDPTAGTMRNPSTASLYLAGKLGPAPTVTYSCSGSTSRIEHRRPSALASTIRTIAASVSDRVGALGLVSYSAIAPSTSPLLVAVIGTDQQDATPAIRAA